MNVTLFAVINVIDKYIEYTRTEPDGFGLPFCCSRCLECVEAVVRSDVHTRFEFRITNCNKEEYDGVH